MKRSFEDRNRKPVNPSKITTMSEFMNKQIERVILAQKETRIFSRWELPWQTG